MLRLSIASFCMACLALGSSAQTVPTLRNGKYSFAFKGLHFEVDPRSGGRISSFKLHDQEALYVDSSQQNNNWGSTFWPAPQSVWGWPPLDTLDRLPYKASVKGTTLTLKSQPTTKGVSASFEKSFRMNEADLCMTVTYKITNTGKEPQSLGPWQIARVPSGGLTFFPTGTTDATGMLLPLLKQQNDVSWFVYDSSFISKDPQAVPKLFADGSEGWLGHVNKHNHLLLFKFTDTPAEQKSPGEDEIEIYTNPNLTYTELEPLGPNTTIQPGHSLTWQVSWYLRALPKGVKASVGNKDLVHFAQTVAGKIKAPTRTK